MSEDPTRSFTSDDIEPEAAPSDVNSSDDADQKQNSDTRPNTRSVLLIGGIGCAAVFGLCMCVALVAVWIGDNEDSDQTPTMEVAGEQVESSDDVTPEPTPTPSPEPTATEIPPTATPEPSPTPNPTSTPTPQPTPSPTPTPEPTPTPAPTPTPEPSGPAVAFSNGTFRVGEDIEPGLYFANNPSSSCYWERLSGFGGSLDDIIANQFTGERQIVFIDSTDVGFSSERCGRWERDAAPIRSDPAAPLDDGMYLVGTELTPGTWRSEGSDGSCYWARLSNFSGELSGIITNSFGGVGDIVQISPGDAGFESSRCGPWTRIGD